MEVFCGGVHVGVAVDTAVGLDTDFDVGGCGAVIVVFLILLRLHSNDTF